MIALTSISPSHYHSDIQKICTDSWKEHGLKVYSFNSPKEVNILKDLYPDVTFIPTYRTMEHTFGKPYVQINAMLDWAKDQNEEHILIINSDILLHEAHNAIREGFLHAYLSLAYVHRRDYREDLAVYKKMTWGFDIFFINRKHLHVFPQTVFCFGITHWDYWFPYMAKKAGLSLVEIDLPAYHKEHPTQWSEQQYFKMAQYAIWELNYPDPHLAKRAVQLKREQNIISYVMMKFIKGRI